MKLFIKGILGLGVIAGVCGTGYLFEKNIRIFIHDGPNGNGWFFKPLNIDLGKLGIPKDCILEEKDTHRECDVGAESIGKMAFEYKEEEKDLTVEGLDNGLKIKLKVEKIENGGRKYPGGFKLTFKEIDGTVKIFGKRGWWGTRKNIVFIREKEYEFSIRGGVLHQILNPLEKLKDKVQGMVV